jgi:signal transduction histidine kinase/sugar lactone lactonase YvrE
MKKDSQGRIWASGNRRGISIIDPVKGEVRKIISESDLNGLGIGTLFEWNDGIVMGSFEGGVAWYDPESGSSKVVVDSLLTDRITDFATDKDNNLYIATNGDGIWVLDSDTGARKRLTTENALVSEDVMSLRTDSQGKLWVAGLKGVQRIDLEKQEISLFTKEQGLSANDIYDLALRDGKVYTGDSRGISVLEQYDVENDRWKVYSLGRDQGMIEIDISQNSFSFDEEGHLWAGANARALIVADPVEVDTISYPVTISGLNLLGKNTQYFDPEYRKEAWVGQDSVWIWRNAQFTLLNEIEKDSLSGTNELVNFSKIDPESGMPLDLELDHEQNYMSFDYNGGQFKNSGAMVYSYILEGVDKSWSKITSETRSENYRDLPPGNYTFKVAGKGFNDVWSEPAEFSFQIMPPWWKTRWAYLIYFVLIASSAYAFVQYRSRWLKRENRLLEERVNQRTAQLKKTIDELETTQGQLIQSEKMASLGELTAGIAHEIQNPMNFINNFSEVSHELLDEMMEEIDKGDMEEAKEISNDIKQNLEKISHHGHRASSIVRGMLEHSRNSSGQKEDIDINVLADEYLRLAYHGLRAKDKSFNAKFETDFDDSIGKIEIIPQDIGRVMLNLINNAFYAVSDRDDKESDESYQPTVKVTTKKLKDQVKITVEDNGSGIPQDIKDKIFQPFFTTKPSGKGTGLGLSLTYDIITQGHSGALELDSEVGKGTVFTIFLPVKQ